MPSFLPFRALRPVREKVARFSAKSSDFKNLDEVAKDMISYPESFYHVTKQNLIYKTEKSVEKLFCIGADFVEAKTQEGVLIRDETPMYYLYQQVDHSSGRSYTGLIGLVDVEDLKNNRIKKHELTNVVREEYLYNQLHYTEVLGEPVLMGYHGNEEINKLIQKYTSLDPEYDFVTPDDKEHLVWLIQSSKDLKYLEDSLNNIEAFYIADGHHRSASAERNYERNPDPSNRNYMVYLLEENQFHIESFHRLLSDMEDELVDLPFKLSENFVVEKYIEGELFQPEKHAQFGILTRDHSFKLTLLNEGDSTNPEKHLDVTLLEEKMLKPIFNIHFPRTDYRLSYISSKEDLSGIKKLLYKKKLDMIISNFPVQFSEVKAIADAQKTMPPKSTYIEPKLRGGLIMQKFIK